MSRTTVYEARIRTDSADSRALLLLAGGELVAILVQLDDEGHGEDRHGWTIETLFDGYDGRAPAPPAFPTATAAAAWVSDHLGHRAFELGGELPVLE